MRFQMGKSGRSRRPPPPLLVGTGVSAGPTYVTHLTEDWYQHYKWPCTEQKKRVCREIEEAYVSGFALIIVDMLKDNVNTEKHGVMDIQGKNIVPGILELTRAFRKAGEKVVFACDSFLEGDFLFQSRMKPHAIRGSGGELPIDDLEMQPGDVFLPKRRMSAFYKTDLDQSLRLWGVHTVVVCGIATNVCVLITALDALQNDFRSVIAADSCASWDPELHDMTLKIANIGVLHPLIRIMSNDAIVEEMAKPCS